MEVPDKGFFRLTLGAEVRLRYAYIVKCTHLVKDEQGKILEIHCTYDPATKSGTAGAKARKVRGNIHWLSTTYAQPVEIRLYDRLFSDPHPDTESKDFKTLLNSDSKKIITGYVESSLLEAQAEESFQFERHGYFVADKIDTQPGKPIFNRTVSLRNIWIKITEDIKATDELVAKK